MQAPGPAHRKRPDCFYKADVTWTWRKNFFVTMVECRNEAGAAAGEAVLLLGRGKREVTLQAAENQRRH